MITANIDAVTIFKHLKFIGMRCSVNPDSVLIFYNSTGIFAYIEPYVLFDLLRFTDTITALNLIRRGGTWMLNITNIMSNEDKKLTEIVNSLKARIYDMDDRIKLAGLQGKTGSQFYYQICKKAIQSDLNIIESIIDSE